MILCIAPVCTTELGAVARLSDEWAKRNVKVIGLSVNTLTDHEGWVKDINETQVTSPCFNARIALLLSPSLQMLIAK
jgi:alkyl hydroperoxide reductase subunit AhpC